MVEKIVQHKHCRECEKAISFKKDFCSDDCEENWKVKMIKKKRQLGFLYISAFIIMILALLWTMWG